jgi:hypothetical protein
MRIVGHAKSARVNSEAASARSAGAVWACALVLVLSACATARVDPGFTADARGRYREILCAVLDARYDSIGASESCDETLIALADERKAFGAPVDLSPSRGAITVLYVPGLWSECFGGEDITTAAMKDYLARFGYHFLPVRVSGAASSAWNARRIRDALLQIPDRGAAQRIVVVGHSKGVVDTLEALVRYPQVRERITAVISLAGAVGGSPLADPPPVELLQISSLIPGVACRQEGDRGAIASLSRSARQRWLSRHPLPLEVHYYSVIAMPEPWRVSLGLRVPYELLSGIARNDGNLLVRDQIIPGSTLLAYVNADHWAVGADLAASSDQAVRAAADRNDFPRAQTLEAALRFVEEDLRLADDGEPGPDRLPAL